ncbi:MAG: PDDEXK nuclease domain-containing protein [Arcicella sp.]|nr:PDDEXK nuclease domain-containing protein [Arcicella sp.]
MPLTPQLHFRNGKLEGESILCHYTSLKYTYSEKSLEDAILRGLEQFILELGSRFTFVERQKQMIFDGEDLKLTSTTTNNLSQPRRGFSQLYKSIDFDTKKILVTV